MRTTALGTKPAAFAAAAFFLLAISLRGPAEARAQWASGGGNTTTPDNVGVGTASPPQATLHVQRDTNGDAKLLLINAGAGANSRSIFLLGEADSNVRYGYLAYFGANNSAAINGQVLTNSTVLTNTGAGGLRLFSLGGTGVAGGVITFSTAPVGNNNASAERMRIDANGNVGIGPNVTNPVTLLHVGGQADNLFQVVGTGMGATDTVAHFSSPAGSILLVRGSGKVGIGKDASASHRLDVAGGVKVTHNTGAADGNLTVDGTITGGNIQAKYQDVAEWVPSVQKLAPGTVVVLDTRHANHVLASTAAYDTRVAGVVSAQPGVILGVAGEGKVMVATTGRVKVRVDATRGAVRIGDLIVTSDVEGTAMRSEPVALGGRQFHAPGTIIGKALEPLEKGAGEILVLLSLQ